MSSKPPRRPAENLIPDISLWDTAKRAIKPLQVKSTPSQPFIEYDPPPKPSVKERGLTGTPSQRAASLSPNKPPPLTGLDRRTTQKLVRGKLQYEAKLDLHGTSVAQARGRLLSFLADARARKLRLVLVITGKGDSPFARHTLHGNTHFHTPERLGRIRRAVSEWLGEPEFRHHITGFQPAHPKHGGGGAYYVMLRRTGIFGR